MPAKNYREDLLVRLSDAHYASQYLKAALDEALQDGNRSAFLLALKNLVDATGPVQGVENRKVLSLSGLAESRIPRFQRRECQ
jgi:DNA-binding phage protein